MKKEKLIKKYDSHAKVYKNTRNNRTLSRWRKRMIKDASGKVLEVGVGGGANFPYYNDESVQVTGVDFSPKMIEHAKQAALDYQIKADFIQSDVNELHIEPNTFNCIVSTLTLCSYPDPVATLTNMSTWCKQDGLILLMEHGLSSNGLLSTTQKMIDPLFIKISGCHCDRDILKIVEQSGIQVIHNERHWAGMVNLIWAKPQS